MAHGQKPQRTGLTLSTTMFQRISDCDALAWNTFVRIYGPVIYQWCRKDGLSECDAADVGQDVFRAVSTSIQRFDRSANANFLGWLRTITRFKVADHFRQSSQLPQAVGGTEFQAVVAGMADAGSKLDSTSAEIDERLDDAEAANAQQLITQQTLAVIKSRFSTQAWTAFWETAVNGRSASDVGEELGMTAMAVRKAKSRVLRRLKTEMDDVFPKN
ncbi:MAG: sigma-70 family RNA polymerase sigma factor [Planctomycetales bacterium]|nr:sigma-70 family RNA polymerase sigma factor [Planctomycetales bacterium]